MKLEVGMYVKTTYGIGRINKSFIVYSDDGYLWHLCYMTDNPKIEIGIYTKELMYGGEIQKDHNIKYELLENKKYFVDEVYKQELEDFVCYCPVRNGIPRNAELFDDHKFINASFNIIDLIEVGDYVNGSKVIDVSIIGKDKEKWVWVEQMEDNDNKYGDDYVGYNNEQIKSIVTKEQFESMKYSLEG